MSRIRAKAPGLLLIGGLAWFSAGGAVAESPGLSVARLETNAAQQPLGIDDAFPRFSWILASSRRGVMQVSYRVLVASTLELARKGHADVWDFRADPHVREGYFYANEAPGWGSRWMRRRRTAPSSSSSTLSTRRCRQWM